jgi:hypothetical protein
MKIKFLSVLLLVFFIIPVFPQSSKATKITRSGIIEFGVHYSSWNINLLSGLIEDLMIPDIKDYDEDKGEFNFDSSGNNLGFEIRIFPGGKNGAFSLGLSYERNNFNGTITGHYTEIMGKSIINATLKGDINLFPHSFNLNLRWDLFAGAKFHPYIGFGIGIGAMNGTIIYKGSVKTTYKNLTFDIDVIDEEYTLKELLKEGDNKIPINFIPILQFQFGFRYELVDKVYILVEAAVYDGIIFRGGLAYRF